MAKKRHPIDDLIDALVCMRREEAMKKLTKSERLVDEQMPAILEWAAEHPKRWHDIGKLPESRKAAELLAERGVIEIRDPMNQYRLTPK